MSDPSRRKRPTIDASWAPLPGLFEESEIADAPDLEIWAEPILIAEGRILYGIYARSREIPAANASATFRAIDPRHTTSVVGAASSDLAASPVVTVTAAVGLSTARAVSRAEVNSAERAIDSLVHSGPDNDSKRPAA